MFINCRHCNTLVATDPATGLPPERCPRCAGVLRRPAPVADAQVAADAGADPSPDAGKRETAPAAAAPAGSGMTPALEPAPPDDPGPRDPAIAVPAQPDAPSAPASDAVTVDAAAADASPAPSEAPPTDAPPPQAREGAAAVNTPSPPGFLGGIPTPPPQRSPSAWRQLVVIAVLLALLGLQIVLADRERLAADARWRPLVSGICGVLGCSVQPWREPQAFVLLAREVAPHPQRSDALRARASFRNDARWPQPWPQLLLTLSDVDGRAVAARAFTPDQYLGGAPATPLVEPGQTVDIALDIREPSVETVSYAWDLR
ncbi:DUF3426 domain-containing protein [Luteimonas sp. A482]